MPFTTLADTWQPILGDASARVAELVGPIMPSPLALVRPIPGVERAVARALLALDIAHHGVKVVSHDSPEPLVATLSGEAKRYLDIRPRDVLARAVDWRMAGRLDELIAGRCMPLAIEALGAEKVRRVRSRLWLDLVRRPDADGRNGWGELGRMILSVRHMTLTCLACLVARGGEDPLAQPLAIITGLIASGNAPLGSIDDGSFVVATA